MFVDKFGRIIYDEREIIDSLMRDQDKLPGPFLIKDDSIDIEVVNKISGYQALQKYEKLDMSVEEFDKKKQSEWLMPSYYKNFDICQYVLDLCENEAELQRCAQELLMYNDRDMIDLLRYMKYLVDTMEMNNIIWGVGRGSSVASFVLYKLKVHKINSLYYDLDIEEFLR